MAVSKDGKVNGLEKESVELGSHISDSCPGMVSTQTHSSRSP